MRMLEVAYENTVALSAEFLDLRGNIIAVIGHNGAGKSTFMKSILGLLPPRHGKIETRYFTPSDSYALVPQQHMAFCPESGAVFADISVKSYVELWCRIKHGDGHFYRKGGSKYVEMMNLAPLFPKLGRELSKGQRRRVQTAIGFLIEPKLFLVDEPFDGLDVQKTNELADIIREQSSERSFIVSSHRMDVVERLADTLIVLKNGRFISHGSVEKVCVDLCRKSVTLSNLSQPDVAITAIKTRFPTGLVTRIGNHISLVGAEFDSESLNSLVRQIGQEGVEIEEKQPSLVDAMNYHLRNVEFSAAA